MFVKCIGVVASGIAARLLPRLWRHGDLDDLCDVASICSGIASVFTVFARDAALGRANGSAESWVEELQGLCMGAVFALAPLYVPRVVVQFLLTQALRRRFDTLMPGDQMKVGKHERHDAVFVSRRDEMCLFIVTFGKRKDDTYIMELSRDAFVHIASNTRGLRATLNPKQRSRCELVALVREKARFAMHYRDRLELTAWQLERPARVIQRAVRRALSDPRHPMCRRRLHREWCDLAMTKSF